MFEIIATLCFSHLFIQINRLIKAFEMNMTKETNWCFATYTIHVLVYVFIYIHLVYTRDSFNQQLCQFQSYCVRDFFLLIPGLSLLHQMNITDGLHMHVIYYELPCDYLNICPENLAWLWMSKSSSDNHINTVTGNHVNPIILLTIWINMSHIICDHEFHNLKTLTLKLKPNSVDHA